MTKFKAGDKVRHKSSGHFGVVTERIEIEQGHQLVAPAPGDTSDGLQSGKYEPRVDLRVKYTDDAGHKAEVLLPEAEVEAV
jgi:hypothetical protein